jgi:hypothetical protein
MQVYKKSIFHTKSVYLQTSIDKSILLYHIISFLCFLAHYQSPENPVHQHHQSWIFAHHLNFGVISCHIQPSSVTCFKVTLIIIERAANMCCLPHASNVFAEHRTQNSKILSSHGVPQTQCSANLYLM